MLGIIYMLRATKYLPRGCERDKGMQVFCWRQPFSDMIKRAKNVQQNNLYRGEKVSLTCYADAFRSSSRDRCPQVIHWTFGSWLPYSRYPSMPKHLEVPFERDLIQAYSILGTTYPRSSRLVT
jgi:hypothetical protein